jgi:formylglycine-generating enzyme required for sulfatase activity
MGKYELTKAQWTAVMGTTPWSGRPYVLDDPDSPAVYISWDMIAGAGGFIESLNAANPGMNFRLPSEAQWEYACRAGTTTRFYWGDDPSYTEIGNYAWYEGNAWNAGQQYAHVVGQKLPNAFGLYDMSGNVWEWCQDWCHSNYTGAPTDGSAWESPTDSSRVLRGGSWCNNNDSCRSATRYGYYPGRVLSYIGFRLSR